MEKTKRRGKSRHICNIFALTYVNLVPTLRISNQCFSMQFAYQNPTQCTTNSLSKIKLHWNQFFFWHKFELILIKCVLCKVDFWYSAIYCVHVQYVNSIICMCVSLRMCVCGLCARECVYVCRHMKRHLCERWNNQ